MNRVAGILIVLAMALPSGAQAPGSKQKLPDYYPLKPGTKWTYQLDTGDGSKAQMTAQIAKNETIDGKSMARLEASLNGNVMATEHLNSTPEGVFRCKYNGVDCTPPLCIFKYPFKEEAMWEADATIGVQQLNAKFVTTNFEMVTTPAGKYKTAPVELDVIVNGTKIKTKFWLRRTWESSNKTSRSATRESRRSSSNSRRVSRYNSLTWKAGRGCFG